MATTLLTDYGNTKILNAIATETTVSITGIAYGDGDGAQYVPTTDQTALKHQIGIITSITKEFNQTDGFIYFKGTIPANADSFTLREFGLIDDNGELMSVTVVPDVEKPLASDGVSIALPISLGFKASIGDVMVIVEDGTDVYANVNLNNLTTSGEHHFDTTYAKTNLDNLTLEGERHFLGRTHITNCITEVPQRINYTLNDGTLTIKAGSTIIVPYGTTNLSSTYTQNSEFLNANFKVYSTQFKDNKFFVWATLQNDISTTYTSGSFGLSVFVDATNNTIVRYDRRTDASGTSLPSGSTLSFYNTSTNDISRYSAGSATVGALSFPVCRISTSENKIATVDEIFNGISHMGSVVIIDKDVRLLIPNGRNTNGSLNNEPYITSNLIFNNMNSTSATYVFFYDYTNNIIKSIDENAFFLNTPNDTLTTERIYYDFTTNTYTQYVSNSTSHTNDLYCQLGTFYRDTNILNSILNFKEKFAFRAMDYNDIESLNTQIQSVRNIGDPIITLSNTCGDDEIWLEGAAVSRTQYANLWNLWGTTYGAGDGSTTFNLPDFRDRVAWGAGENNFGYIEAGLPDHTHYLTRKYGDAKPTSAERGYFSSESSSATRLPMASEYNPIYGASNTVQPPAIKVRVKTRYK